jgi:hypothetical protein
MGSQQAFHVAPEHRIIPAFGGEQFITSGARRQFRRPGEHVFDTGGRLIHRALKPVSTLASALTSASAKIIDPFRPLIPLCIR